MGTLGALFVGRQTGILATNEEKQEARLFKRDKVLASLEPAEKFDELVKQGDSTGLLVYTAYERNGRYVPATEERAAQNVPYPVLQPGMNEYNRGGFYIFQAYFYAALNYFYYTGDTKPLSEVINPEEIISPELLRLYRETAVGLLLIRMCTVYRSRFPVSVDVNRTAVISANTKQGDVFAMRLSSTYPKRGRSYPSISS